MTVAELIEKLSKYPSDMRVIVEGYEDGYNDTTGPCGPYDIVLNYHNESWYGNHEIVKNTYKTEEELKDYQKDTAVLIN